MSQFLFAIFGLISGALCVYAATERRRRRVESLAQEMAESGGRAQEAWDDFRAKQKQLHDVVAARQKEIYDAVAAKQKQLQSQTDQFNAECDYKQRELAQMEKDLKQRLLQCDEASKEINAKKISLDELQHENALLKRDLFSHHVNVKKQALDYEVLREQQELSDTRSRELAVVYLRETIKSIGTSLNPNNYTLCKQRLITAIDWCRKIGFSVSADDEINQVCELKAQYERVVRATHEREEQARIKAKMREEFLLQRDRDRELQRLAREQEAIRLALEKALADAHDQHSAEVDILRQRLAEAEERSQRAISQAQLTRAGHVYVISNIGSFGKGVFKIGLTRRLEPDDRVRELSGAAVPFPFDVHMMISCDDAPKLEYTLHKSLHKCRMNRANLRKEFFKTDIEEIKRLVIQHHGEIEYVADAEALEFNQSLTMPDDDQEFIASVYDSVDEGDEIDID